MSKIIRRRKTGDVVQEEVFCNGDEPVRVTRERSPEDPLDVNGVFYRNLRSFAYEMGFSYSRVLARFKAGKEGSGLIPGASDAVTVGGKRGTSITVNGVEYDSIAEVAKKYELSHSLVYSRHRKGLQDDELIAPPGPRGRRKRAVDLNFPESVISKEVVGGGRRRGTEVVINGRHYSSISEIARAYGLNVATVQYRYNKGLRGLELIRKGRTAANPVQPGLKSDQPTPAEAKKRGRPGHPITIDGTTYSSVREAAKQLNVPLGRLRKQIKEYGSVTGEQLMAL